ncbi:3991_t:CDS:1, partial [Gigaspora margarita]
TDLGYKASVLVPYNERLNWSTEVKMHQAVLAFADDMTWLASNKSQLEQILQIAEDFYKMNDIQINNKKSKLMIINPSVSKESRKIKIGGDWLYEEKNSKVIRFLGIWVDNRLNEKQIKEKAKSLVRVTAGILSSKK